MKSPFPALRGLLSVFRPLRLGMPRALCQAYSPIGMHRLFLHRWPDRHNRNGVSLLPWHRGPGKNSRRMTGVCTSGGIPTADGRARSTFVLFRLHTALRLLSQAYLRLWLRSVLCSWLFCRSVFRPAYRQAS